MVQLYGNFKNVVLAKGIINIGRNLKIRGKEKEIFKRILKQLSNERKRTPSEDISLEKIFSKVACYYAISIGTARKIYKRNQISDGKIIKRIK